VLGAQWLESQEQEVPDDVLVVVVVIVEAGDDVVDAELVLGVLEQRDEGLLGPFSQLQLGDRDVEPVLVENSLPVAAHPAHARRREAQLQRLLSTADGWRRRRRAGGLAAVAAAAAGWRGRRWILANKLRVRGISYIPRASALWELPTCAGNIKPAVEAPRRGC